KVAPVRCRTAPSSPGASRAPPNPPTRNPQVNAVDLIVIVVVLALAAIGFERGLVRSALPLAGFVAGAAIGGRLGPALLSGGSESAYAPLVTVLSGLVLGAVLAVALEGAGFAIHQAWNAGPLASRLDGLGGA